MIDDFDPTAAEHLRMPEPTQDLDSDGVLDTVVGDGGVFAVISGDEGASGVEFVSDFDGDGYADHLAFVDESGAFESWELTSGADGDWVRTDSGSL